ncbi:MAG: cellulase family glycosylhydrolase [Treponema sp.]|nr:cellulase family glycosylhydrolase [Treponema sp.]
MNWYGFNMLWMFSSDGKEGSKCPASVHIDENDLDFIASMGCNFIRLPVDYRFILHDFKYDQPDEAMLKVLDRCVYAIVSRGLHCSLNVHRAPGYCINGNELERDNLWTDKIAQDAFTDLWKLLALRYASYSPKQLSFDLLNEPPSVGQYGLTRENHKAIMSRVVSEIRKISPERTIVCDGLGGGHQACPELADLGVVLSGRGYMPMRLTHFQAEWMKKNGSYDWDYPKWPGMKCDGIEWSRDALLEFYKPWKALADGGSRVHIGECGCYNKVTNETALAWYKDFFSVLNQLDFGFALWNFRGPFGVAEHRRSGTNWEVRNGITFDRDLYELFVQSMKQ